MDQEGLSGKRMTPNEIMNILNESAYLPYNNTCVKSHLSFNHLTLSQQSRSCISTGLRANKKKIIEGRCIAIFEHN
jgi:hypothetical protein